MAQQVQAEKRPFQFFHALTEVGIDVELPQELGFGNTENHSISHYGCSREGPPQG